MASSKDQIVCHVCGFKNDPTAERCVSCGAKLEELSGAYSAEEEARKRGQQKGFSLKWAAVALVVYLVLQAVALMALPMAIDAYDPQGFSALVISFVVWFVGGLMVGLVSPGKTFVEPAVAAGLAIGPVTWWLAAMTPEAPERLGGGFQLTTTAYFISTLFGGAVSIFGAIVGEKIQDMMRGRS